MRRASVVMLGLAALVGGLPAAGQAGAVRAGVGVVDATWHVGASAGQYASEHPCDVTNPPSCASPDTDTFDPYLHQTHRAPSYGIQSRTSVRALVVEGADGTRVALMKTDLYIPQDLLAERIATILEARDAAVRAGLAPGPETRIDHTNLMMAVTHNHSSPYYSTPSWGVWLYQDVFDLRFFEYLAQRSAEAVVRAVSALRPVRMGATIVPYQLAKRHSFGPAIADDGTPAGYPHDDLDRRITVLRFDDISGPAPRPYAIFMTLGLHPEMLEGNNLITGEYVAALERMVQAATGATLIFAQNDTGTSEPAVDCIPWGCAARAEFSHREYAQAERAARSIADAVLEGFSAIGEGRGIVPFSSNFPVGVIDRQYAPPYSHPYPSVSNCRTPEAADGNPGVPIIGLPDCERVTGGALKPYLDALGPLDPGVTYDRLRQAGIPVPDNYSAPSYSGLQETLQVHLQAFRFGEVLVTVCPCEQWADQSRNIASRADKVQNNLYLGYDWGAQCTSNPDGTWTCPNPRGGPPLRVDDYRYRRMRAQVLNDARGWDDLANAAYAESEPYDPAAIRGNYTHEELPPQFGYDLVVTVGMANDYWGYIATYREYQRGDHYRKALTGLGPHASDWLATRLVRMGGALKGCPEEVCPTAYNPLDLAYMVDGAHQHARAVALGQAAQVYVALYEAALPADPGPPRTVSEPEDIRRFDVTSFSWVGGSNYTDDPQVRVQRLGPSGWTDYGDMSGDVVVTLDLPPLGPEAVTGGWEWHWTAHFEAFDSDIDTGRGRQTPSGIYRFVVDGLRRVGGGVVEPYHLESRPFAVHPWDGITVSDLQVLPGGASFAVGPVNLKDYCTSYPCRGSVVQRSSALAGEVDYPDAWPAAKMPAAPESGDKLFPRLERTVVGGNQLYCFPCTFRPWADAGAVVSATLTVHRAGGGVEQVPAQRLAPGRWGAALSLGPGDCVSVDAGAVVDEYGERNGSSSAQACL